MVCLQSRMLTWSFYKLELYTGRHSIPLKYILVLLLNIIKISDIKIFVKVCPNYVRPLINKFFRQNYNEPDK